MNRARGVLRAEIPMETIVGQSGGIHELPDAHTIDARLAKRLEAAARMRSPSPTETGKGQGNEYQDVTAPRMQFAIYRNLFANIPI
jgi:hypothetical protein